jgi:prepilin-type N-terminal cleavage/methylation domain-containing protein
MVTGRISEWEQRNSGPCGRTAKGSRCQFASPRGAFTLIELLVVIAIIALLMAILFPVLSRVRKQAKAMICRSHLRQWGLTLSAYTEEHEGRFPATIGGMDGFWLLRGAFISNQDPNAPQDSFHHFHTKDIACCPEATQPSGRAGGFSAGGNMDSFSLSASYKIQGTPGSVFGAWEITAPAPAFRGSYGLNDWLSKGFHRAFFDAAMLSHGRLDMNVLLLQGRSTIPVLLDAVMPWSDPTDMWSPPMNAEIVSGVDIQNFCINRHNGCVNGLFLDWSVRKVDLKELWTLNWYTEFNRAGRWTKAGGVKPQQWPKWMRGLKDY